MMNYNINCTFTGNYLITFIRTWQIILNRSEVAHFEMNTYIISALVIFFLQMEHNFPTIGETAIRSTVSNFKNALKGFFNFYGNHYEIQNHVISTQIGQWQQRHVQPGQKFVDPAQQQCVFFRIWHQISSKRQTIKTWNKFIHRLREGIKTSPENWQNCTMYVQDLVRPDLNIAAEISEADAFCFQKMCQIFAKNMEL